ncbi:hypothetical protein SAMN05216203_2052 [Marinobacter daqiaonensis]|uniref:Uncharacterized protein n=1 Tax=Marinobacter daqiaonensis TaxID=650891 RepID=A0A1I6IAY7_9GAMM|nr:hypothetical protein [Marinobacter daqiaonensis]SFR63848.1 hypothetical protein SAMN05216203_2052 [Marinobacter daqiaonensis]
MCRYPLRVHGIPELIHDPELNKALSSQSQQSLLVTRVAVTSSYFHCGKALIRSGAWSQDAQQAPIKVSFGAEIANNQGLSGDIIADIDAGVAQRYRTDI